MVDFLLEIGTEEIPAFSIEPAVQDLLDRVTRGLEEAGLSAAAARTAATPRRLTIFLSGLPETQPDREEEVSGPPERAAFDQKGNPTKAAIGFAKGQGLAVADIELRDTPKGRYCFLKKKTPGRSTAAVLAELLPEAVAGVHFPKSMRWVPGKSISFSRPIRSIAALLGGEVVRFAAAGVESGREVFGHPFLAPEPFELAKADMDLYLRELKKRRVVADIEERRALVRSGVEACLAAHGGSIDDPSLVDEVTNLVESPCVLEGRFHDRFLHLPAPVIRCAMMDHQRYFPVQDAKGQILPRFVTVTNRGKEHAALIREGNERVLAARLADAAFFLASDRKKSLAARVDDLQGIVYQEKLGTYLNRVQRLKALAGHLADALGVTPAEKERCGRAALLCKSDLTTEMVSEFPSLQGVVGKEYALMDGEEPSVAEALEEHYLPAFAGDRLPATTEGRIIALADKFDAVVGCFAVGLSPTGSQDPYGLRRQALGILRIILEGSLRLSLKETVCFAASQLPPGLPPHEMLESRVLDFFWDRLYNFCTEKRVRYDLVKAALAAGYDDVRDFWKRLEGLKALAAEPGWPDLVTVVQRTYNIYKKAEDPGEVDPKRLEAPEEQEVYRLFEAAAPKIRALLDQGRYADASRLFARTFVTPVHQFFDKVFVNVEDAKLRNNRMALMKALNRLYTERIADLSEIVVEA